MSKKLTTEKEIDDFLDDFFNSPDKPAAPKKVEKKQVSNGFTEEVKDFDLLCEKDKKKYKVKMVKTKSNIIISCQDYSIKYGKEPAESTKLDFQNIEQEYKYLLNMFEKNDPIIKEIVEGREIRVILTDTSGRKKKVPINLKCNHPKSNERKNKNNLLGHKTKRNIEKEKENENENERNEEEKEKDKERNRGRGREREREREREKDRERGNSSSSNSSSDDSELGYKGKQMKPFNIELTQNNKKHVYFKSNPTNISLYKELTQNSFYKWILDNTFCVFKSVQYDILYLIYSSNTRSIISYNLSALKIDAEIKYAHHDKDVSFYSYFIDKKNNNRELILSGDYTAIKIWNFANWENLTTITKIYCGNLNNKRYINASCFMYYNSEIFILTCGNNLQDPIKVFNLNGKKKNEITDKRESFFIDTYYENDLYLLTANRHSITSYVYDENRIYHKYFEPSVNTGYHVSFLVVRTGGVTTIIESCYLFHVRIWDFHLARMLKKIRVGNNILRGICLWNENFLCVGSGDKSIKIVDLKNGVVTKTLGGNKLEICTVKKVNHPLYGECLISQGKLDDQIKMWFIKS